MLVRRQITLMKKITVVNILARDPDHKRPRSMDYQVT